MPEDFESFKAQQLETLLTSAAWQDMRPAAATRIEAVCLSRMRRRNPPAEWQVTFWRVLEAALTSLLGGSYLLWNLGQALALYGIHLR